MVDSLFGEWTCVGYGLFVISYIFSTSCFTGFLILRLLIRLLSSPFRSDSKYVNLFSLLHLLNEEVIIVSLLTIYMDSVLFDFLALDAGICGFVVVLLEELLVLIILLYLWRGLFLLRKVGISRVSHFC